MKTIIVKSGDTLWGLSRDYKVSVADIKSFNDLKTDTIFVGQVLKLESDKPKSHVIVKGDTVQGICATYGLDVGDFKRVNSIVNNALYINRVVSLECASSGVVPVPVAPTWYYPVLPYAKYNNNFGQFLSDSYYAEIGAVHPGVDLNGNGGGNSDWRDPIYAACDGIVVDAGWYPVWGNMVKIWHPYDKVWTIYAHLETMMVSIGMSVKGGGQIGTMGRGAKNKYYAHLHFEIRKTDLKTQNWPSTMYPIKKQADAYTLVNYYHPIVFLESKNARKVA